MLLPEHAAEHNKRRELSNLQDLPSAIDRPRVRGLTECDRAILDAVLGDIAPDPITRDEVYRLHRVHSEAEDIFIKAYTADPNRGRMRPGDFRYRFDLHSTATRAAGDAFVTAGDVWRTAARDLLAKLRKDGKS